MSREKPVRVRLLEGRRVIVRAATLDDAAGIARVHLDTWRTAERRGLEYLLTRAVATMLVAAGFDAMLVWVLATYACAKRFCEALGGQLLRDMSQIPSTGRSLSPRSGPSRISPNRSVDKSSQGDLEGARKPA